MDSRYVISASVAALLLAALTGCASDTDAGAAPDADRTGSLGALPPALPEGEVVGQGTVIDADGAAKLCLGGVAESYPPQCSGTPLEGWSWDAVDGEESSGDMTWGAYAVQGAYDGSAITVTQPPILLALYDPIQSQDPTGGRVGRGREADLIAIQDTLPDRLGADYLGSGPRDGRLWISVVWDDGTWQDAADAEFGEDVVVVTSALRPVE